MVKIYTKSGDNGKTNLLFGGNTSKSALRVETYGTVDEAVSFLGLAKSLIANNDIRKIIEDLQHSLFIIGAELATTPQNKKKLNDQVKTITTDMVKEMGGKIAFGRAFDIEKWTLLLQRGKAELELWEMKNLSNERYEQPATYAQDGRSIRFGFKTTF